MNSKNCPNKAPGCVHALITAPIYHPIGHNPNLQQECDAFVIGNIGSLDALIPITPRKRNGFLFKRAPYHKKKKNNT
jgi:hypothetical protein